MNTVTWDFVKEFYKEKFGINEWVIEMYANMDILNLCASGASNKTIEIFLEIPESDVKAVIKDVFDFDGWLEDLPINPYFIYCNYSGEISSASHFSDFTKSMAIEVSKYFQYMPTDLYTVTERSFYICQTMYDIERKIQDEWI